MGVSAGAGTVVGAPASAAVGALQRGLMVAGRIQAHGSCNCSLDGLRAVAVDAEGGQELGGFASAVAAAGVDAEPGAVEMKKTGRRVLGQRVLEQILERCYCSRNRRKCPVVQALQALVLRQEHRQEQGS